ncbi:MAG: transposase, partial [Fibromonadaceae bacterium]|nr:transposase [Fibromonadaceae bacterium]
EKSRDYFDVLAANEDASGEAGAEKSRKSRKPPSNYNERYVSLTDPDARASTKKGKPLAMNHPGIVSVDTQSHVICGAAADYADKKDCETTEKIMGQTIENLAENGIAVENVLADSGYSSGETFKYLEEQNITAYIPANATCKAQRDGFSYDGGRDCYVCHNGAELPFKKIKAHSGRDTYGKLYRSKTKP